MYNLKPITEERVLAYLKENAAPQIKQANLLDALRGPLEYYEADGEIEVDGVVEKITAGDVIKRPHLDLESALRELRRKGLADFTPKGALGGWVAR